MSSSTVVAPPTAQEIADLTKQSAHLIGATLDPRSPVPVAVARDAMQAAIEHRFSSKKVFLHHGRFNPVEAVLTNFRSHNQEMRLGFGQERIDALLAAIPRYAWEQPLWTLALCWTLGNPTQTANAKIDVLRYVFGMYKITVSEDFRTDSEHLYLPEGAPEFVPYSLRWKVIDLGADGDKAPDQVFVATAAGFEVFDVVAQHDEFAYQMDGDEIPNLDIPGLRLKLPGRSVPYVPGIFHDQKTLQVRADTASFHNTLFARPRIIESRSI